MAKKKYYAVAKGATSKSVGVYSKWSTCKKHIDKVSGAVYKSFSTKEEAKAFIEVYKKYGSINKRDKKLKDKIERIMKEAAIKAKEKEEAKYNRSNEAKYAGKTEEEILNSILDTELVEEDYIRARVKNLKTKDSYIVPEEMFKKYKDEVAIYFVDGSYDRKTKVYGSGIIELYEDKRNNKKIETRSYIASGIDHWNQWNIIGEIEASKGAIVEAVKNKKKKVVIYHDLEGTARWASGKFRAKNEYTKSYVRFIEMYDRKIKIEFIKVKGHSGNKYNDLADELAKKAIKEYKA